MKHSTLHQTLITLLGISSWFRITCELLLAAVSNALLQVLQLMLDFLIFSFGLLTLSPKRIQRGEVRCKCIEH